MMNFSYSNPALIQSALTAAQDMIRLGDKNGDGVISSVDMPFDLLSQMVDRDRSGSVDAFEMAAIHVATTVQLSPGPSANIQQLAVQWYRQNPEAFKQARDAAFTEVQRTANPGSGQAKPMDTSTLMLIMALSKGKSKVNPALLLMLMNFGKEQPAAPPADTAGPPLPFPTAPGAPSAPAAPPVVNTPSGLSYQDVQVGTGPVASRGQQVVVHYTGFLHPSGQKFESSLDRGEPLAFPLGAGVVIPGWDEGIQGMRVGGKRVLTIPPHLAYGMRGSPPKIPPNATLQFQVELLGIQ